MLYNKMIMTTLPVVDKERAKNFYEGKIGLHSPIMETDDEVVYECGNNTRILLYQRAATKADNTAFTFLVDDIENEVDQLKNKGIEFEEYDMPNIKTINSIAVSNGYKMAWFKDSEGNIIGITQM